MDSLNKNKVSLLIFGIILVSVYLMRLMTYSKIIFFIMLTISFIVASLILLSFISMILLDKLYRPNISQYPFNIYLDRIIPIILLLSPFISIIILQPFESWFSRLGILILMHIFILTPIFHYWAKLRRWEDIEDHITYGSWSHPRLYKHIAIASIYPLLWGIYFSISRYIRLGSTIDISSHFYYVDIDIIIILVFISCHLVLISFMLLSKLSRLRRYLWNQLSVLIYSIHVMLLRYDIYFRFMELLFKFHFLVQSFISLRGLIYFVETDPHNLWWRKHLDFWYYNPIWFTINFFSLLFIEILVTGKLHYGIYLLFIYPLLRGLLSCFSAFGHTQFVFDCCRCDYAQGRWTSLRYPLKFWSYFDDAEYFFGFEYDFTPEQWNSIHNARSKSEWKLRKNVSLNSHQSKVHIRINLLNNKYKTQVNKHPFKLRLAAGYMRWNQARWVHTEAIQKFHSCTALFAKSTFDRIVLLNSSWRNLEHIQKTRPFDITSPNMYDSYGQTFSFYRKRFIGVQEENLPSNFVPLIKEGVKVEPYEPSRHKPVFLPQPNPDIIFDFSQSFFKDRRIHALDQKTNNPGIGRNKILSEISRERYESTLLLLERDLSPKISITTDILNVLNQLRKTCLNLEKHQIVWAENIHLFPQDSIPPIKIPQNFSYSQLTKEALREIKRSEYRMKKVSDLLYIKKVPQINHGIFPKEALDLMEDSEMQRILGEEIHIDESLFVN